MIATGCIMARVCHTNNCPVGVASQREELRARFPGEQQWGGAVGSLGVCVFYWQNFGVGWWVKQGCGRGCSGPVGGAAGMLPW